MVDTIVIRIHDLRKHPELVKFVNLNFKGSSKHSAIIPKEDVDEIRKSPIADDKFIVDYFRNSKTGTHIIHYKSQERLNTSGHYYFHAFENRDRDFMEFNFSVPKYKWGTNILHFARHMWDKEFSFYNHSSLRNNLNESYGLLISFIRNFFLREFADMCPIDLSCVEINRIDLSYNQVFDSKKHALEYLEYQKEVRRKHSRKDINQFREYETSLMYTTHRYSLKIYHKGSEYTKHDRKEHKRINILKGKDFFKIDELQSIADKMLRYEVTFRDSMLTYLFCNNVFRKKCPKHKARYEIFKRVEGMKDKNDRISERIGKISDANKKERFRSSHPYLTPDNREKQVHEIMKKLFAQGRQFMLKVDEEVERFNTVTDKYGYVENRALFSRGLFNECARFFMRFIKEFQVTEKPSISTVSDRIDHFNDTHFHKLPRNEMMKFYELFQNNTFEDIRKKGFYSKATYYRYLKRFNEIGVTKNSVIDLDLICVPADLRNYHSLIFTKLQIFNKQ
jgi:hypothetical protein